MKINPNLRIFLLAILPIGFVCFLILSVYPEPLTKKINPIIETYAKELENEGLSKEKIDRNVQLMKNLSEETEYYVDDMFDALFFQIMMLFLIFAVYNTGKKNNVD